MKYIERLFEALASIQKDKLLHFFTASVVLSLLLIFVNDCLAIAMVMFAALCKEVIYDDFLNKGNRSMSDFVYSVLPCVLYIINMHL